MAKNIRYMSMEEKVAGFHEDTIQALATAGWKSIFEAYRQTRFPKNWQHRTFNLHDSYGSAVYDGGKLREDTIKYAVRSRSNGQNVRRSIYGKTGREALDMFFKNNHFGKKNGEVVVVVVAAMWYADILEKKNYYVIKGVAHKELAKNIDEAMIPVYKKWGMESRDISRVVRKGMDYDFIHGLR